jgi:hypothetical protein
MTSINESTMNEFKSKSELPTELAVYVCEVREGNTLWPILRVDQRQDQHVKFVSGRRNAAKGLAVLKEAFELCLEATTEMAQMKEGQR